jgi:hypothetical protein
MKPREEQDSQKAQASLQLEEKFLKVNRETKVKDLSFSQGKIMNKI